MVNLNAIRILVDRNLSMPLQTQMNACGHFRTSWGVTGERKSGYQDPCGNNKFQTARGMAFYNSFRGSSVDNVESIDFKVDETKCVSMGDLTSKSSGSFSVEGMIRWRAP